MMFSPGDSVRVYLPNRSMVQSIALRHRLDAGEQRNDDQQHKRDRENVETSHEILQSRQDALAGARSLILSAKPRAPVQPAVLAIVI